MCVCECVQLKRCLSPPYLYWPYLIFRALLLFSSVMLHLSCIYVYFAVCDTTWPMYKEQMI